MDIRCVTLHLSDHKNYDLQLKVSRKLRLMEVRVPTLVDVRDSNATLECRFELGAGQGLYSVKWYKDDLEFFRYMPDNRPPEWSFPVSGVTLQGNSSNEDSVRVTLTQLSFNSSGTYGCEVSTEAPIFETLLQKQNMTVMALPRSEPTIYGVHPSYSIGERVSAICTADKSYPAPAVTWYINGIKAERWLLDIDPPHDEVDAQGFVTRSLPLHFIAERRFFERPGGAMELRCTATVGDRAWQKLVTPVLATLTNQKLAQEQFDNSGHPDLQAVPLSLLMANLLAAAMFSS
ncbi:uncharacterized protein [Anabrus simplex]|uniref:uncharacterized protein n=1 Tax=Anabrus simplex TaxID=316456 RepID=UPI0035A28A7F